MTAARALLLSGLVVGAAACGAGKPRPLPASVSGRTAAPSSDEAHDEKLLDDLTLLATGSPRGTGVVPVVKGGGAAGYERLIDELLEDPRFSAVIAPTVLLPGQLRRRAPFGVGYVLARFTSPQGLTYYLREKCKESDVELVRPWWSPGTQVRICREAHRPEVQGDPKTGNKCGSTLLAPSVSPLCGCGPNLIHCARDEAHEGELTASSADEVTKTIADIVRRDLPLEDVFLTNETTRDRNAEFRYRRWRIAAGESPSILDDLATWPASGKRAPRHETIPGQHAGILTAPNSIFTDDAPRTVMKVFYDGLWCTGVASVNVSAETVLHLGVTDLRQGDGWQKLASMPICTNCHARLDYGMQFFKGFPSPFHGVDFLPQDQRRGRGPLYVENIDDRIGEAELTPRGFATLAVADKRFGDCMVSNVQSYVLRADASPDDVRALRQTWLPGKTSLKALMRAALRRFVERDLARRRPRPVDEAVAVATKGNDERLTRDTIDVGPALRRDIDTYCAGCHNEAPRDFTGARLPRGSAEAMLGAVAFHVMPKGIVLEDRDRRRLVMGLIEALGGGSDPKGEMARYFLDGFSPLPAHTMAASNRVLEPRTDVPPPLAALPTFESFMSADRTVYSPSFAAVVTLRALATCKAAGLRGEALEACVRKKSSPTLFTVGRP